MQPETALIPMRVRFIYRSGKMLLASIGAVTMLSGCGNVLYTYRANGASVKLEEARQAGAEKTALYEYTLAREHLNKAMSEASEADYGDAYDLAQLADGFAEQALEKAKQRMQAGTRSNGASASSAPSEPSPAAAKSLDAPTGAAGATIEFKGEQN